MLKKLLILLVLSSVSLAPVTHAGFFKNVAKAAQAKIHKAKAEAARIAKANAEAAKKAAAKLAKEKAARAKAARIKAAKAAKAAKKRAKKIAAAKARAAAAALIAKQEAAKSFLEDKLGLSFNFIDFGDYGPLETLQNLKKAPEANNPVSSQLKSEMSFMEFSRNPRGHKDDFNPKRYYQWQVITLDGESTGAQCADGSDYKFLVKRSASSSNMVVFFEAGGGCWDHGTCSKSSGGFTNAGLVGGQSGTPEMGGIATEELGIRAAKLASLTTSAIQPGFNPRYRNWTRVFLPYCTQDIHLGMEDDDILYYENQAEKTGNSMEVRHSGMAIQGAVITWLKDNLEQPGQLLVTGQSAGGFASELLYHPYRLALAPKKGYMLNDAGPIVEAIQGADAEEYPSQFAQETVTKAWNAMPYLRWLEKQSASYAHFNPKNMGSISEFLATRWPKDRFVLAAAQKDNVIAGFSYNTFFPAIYEEESVEVRDELRDEFRLKDMNRKRIQLESLDNYGYFMPGYRYFMGGHVLTFPFIYSSTTNEDDGRHVIDAIHNLMSGKGSVKASWENDLAGDLARRHYGKILDDCINYYYDFSDGDMSSGDVFLGHGGSQTNWTSVITDVLKNDACLRLGAGQISLKGTLSKFIPDL